MSDLAFDALAILNTLTVFANINIDKDSEAAFYAIAQLLHNRLNEADMTSEKKGAILTDLICNFAELNKEHLALFREQRDAFLASKTATKH